MDEGQLEFGFSLGLLEDVPKVRPKGRVVVTPDESAMGGTKPQKSAANYPITEGAVGICRICRKGELLRVGNELRCTYCIGGGYSGSRHNTPSIPLHLRGSRSTNRI